MKPRRLKPDEPIPGLEGAVMGDFWSWAYSTLINIDRGVFAEFMVGHALGVTEGVRPTWEAVDLVYGSHGIEVKSSAYVQAWEQERPSTPKYDIEEKGAWVDDLRTWDPERRRRACVYVFCLHAEKDREKANVLDVSAWEFYVLPTRRIDVELGTQKKVGIGKVRTMTEPVGYPALKKRVDEALTGCSPIHGRPQKF